MGWYGERVLPHLVDRMCGLAELEPWRDDAARGLQGRVVEIGFGSGLNVAHYPPEVATVLAVEPAALARRLAQPRIDRASVSVEHVGLDGQRIPLEDESCDGALCTFTLCTVRDPSAALAEVRRVVKPGGRFHFLEHGLSPDAGVARWQHRLDPVQRRVAGGCHLSRDPVALVESAGFVMERCEQRYGSGPKPWAYMTVGVAQTVAPAA
jgi:ubiquinone/menaquinone biosynthesis C-methylase UbiE